MVDFRGKKKCGVFFVRLKFFLTGSKVQLVWWKESEPAVSWQYFVTWQYLLGRAEECRQRFCYGCPSSERSHGPAHGELDGENVCGTSWLSASFEGHLCAVFALLSALGLFLCNGGSGGCG